MWVSCTKKALPAKIAMAERAGYTKTQITFCSIHLPRTKRTQKNSERMAQSRNMPIQMNSRPQWNLSTIRYQKATRNTHMEMTLTVMVKAASPAARRMLGRVKLEGHRISDTALNQTISSSAMP